MNDTTRIVQSIATFALVFAACSPPHEIASDSARQNQFRNQLSLAELPIGGLDSTISWANREAAAWAAQQLAAHGFEPPIAGGLLLSAVESATEQSDQTVFTFLSTNSIRVEEDRVNYSTFQFYGDGKSATRFKVVPRVLLSTEGGERNLPASTVAAIEFELQATEYVMRARSHIMEQGEEFNVAGAEDLCLESVRYRYFSQPGSVQVSFCVLSSVRVADTGPGFRAEFIEIAFDTAGQLLE